MKLTYANLQEIEDGDGHWGNDLFVDEHGNQYVLTAWYGIEYGYRVSDKEANALVKDLIETA